FMIRELARLVKEVFRFIQCAAKSYAKSPMS
ncbi:hypothetical protein N499_0833B, partial [Wolbachia pipientis wVitA]